MSPINHAETDRRHQRRGERERAPLLPLTAEEQRTWQEQRQGIVVRTDKVRPYFIEEYQLAQYATEVKMAGLWRRDPEFLGLDFLQVLCKITGSKGSQATFDRRLRLVRFYTFEAAIALYDEGVDLIAMVECTYGDARLHDMLLKLAREGKSISTLIEIRKAGNRKLREGKETVSEEDRLSLALLEMQRTLLAEDKEKKNEKTPQEMDEETFRRLSEQAEQRLRAKEAEPRHVRTS